MCIVSGVVVQVIEHVNAKTGSQLPPLTVEVVLAKFLVALEALEHDLAKGCVTVHHELRMRSRYGGARW